MTDEKKAPTVAAHFPRVDEASEPGGRGSLYTLSEVNPEERDAVSRICSDTIQADMRDKFELQSVRRLETEKIDYYVFLRKGATHTNGLVFAFDTGQRQVVRFFTIGK